MKLRILLFLEYLLFWYSIFVVSRIAFLVYHWDQSSQLSFLEALNTFRYGFLLDASMSAYISIIPGLVLTALYTSYVLGVSFIYPNAVPALPPEARLLRGWKLMGRVVFVLIPPLLLIFLVLGTIFLGVATPTEGGAMGATGALALALINRRLSWSLMRQAMNSTAKLTSFVVFILVARPCSASRSAASTATCGWSTCSPACRAGSSAS